MIEQVKYKYAVVLVSVLLAKQKASFNVSWMDYGLWRNIQCMNDRRMEYLTDRARRKGFKAINLKNKVRKFSNKIFQQSIL